MGEEGAGLIEHLVEVEHHSGEEGAEGVGLMKR